MDKISLMGAQALTKAEAKALLKYLDELIDKWPKVKWTKEQHAVARAHNKLSQAAFYHS